MLGSSLQKGHSRTCQSTNCPGATPSPWDLTPQALSLSAQTLGSHPDSQPVWEGQGPLVKAEFPIKYAYFLADSQSSKREARGQKPRKEGGHRVTVQGLLALVGSTSLKPYVLGFKSLFPTTSLEALVTDLTFLNPDLSEKWG